MPPLSFTMRSISPESLLIRSSLPVDPFNRLCTPITPAIAVIEFCQFIGPRALSTASINDENRSIDVDSIALWLMSSETPSGTVVSMFNQQMAVYALAYYFTLYDLQARAFQRPLCIAYLSSEKPNLDTLQTFRTTVRKLTLPLLICNRRLFVNMVRDAVDLSDVVECGVDKYMEKLGSNYSRLKTLCDQAARLRSQVVGLEDQLSFFDSVESECSGHYSSDREVAMEMLMETNTSNLKPIKDIIPCGYDDFTLSLKPLLQSLSRRSLRTGVLYSSGVPVLRYPKYETPVRDCHFGGLSANTSEESLRTMIEHVDNVLFAILSGEDLWVTGSSNRKSTVVDLTTKFNQIRPRSHFNHENHSWIDSNKSIPQGIVGLHSQLLKDGKQKRAIPSAVLDVTTAKIRSSPYSGVLLNALRSKRKFPSDIAFVMFVASFISKICSLVYLSRYVSTNKLKEENLSHDDLCIILNLLTEVDFIKFQKLRSSYLKQRVLPAKTVSL